VPRIREIITYETRLRPGPFNSITDVTGVKVGHNTLIEGDGEWRSGEGPYRTGVTLVIPHQGNLYEEKVPAAVHTINGFGKVAGFEQVRELGSLETPIALTGTLNVPRVADALISMALEQNPHIGIGFDSSGRKGYASVNPLVGETSDGFLSDIHGRPIGEDHVRAAFNNSISGHVAEGVVGAGTGTSCYGWKGGIGTASRVLPVELGAYFIGVLVQTNFGRPEELTVCGTPIGQRLQPPGYRTRVGDGSIMIVLATDAPLDNRQLGRLCRRAAFGLARTGSTCHGGSGDFVIAFSTAYRIEDQPNDTVIRRDVIDNEQLIIGRLGLAVIESVEESIYNSLLMARTIIGRDGNTRYALPADKVATETQGYREGKS